MTNREFFTAIVSANINDELTTFAQEAIEKLDARNAKRSSKPSKTALANEPIKVAIVEYLNGKQNVTASEIAKGLDISVQKASSLLRQLVANETLTVSEVKVPKKGACKAYTIK